MKILLLDAETNAELQAANYGGNPLRQVIPAQLSDGRLILNADLLDDGGAGDTWEYYAHFLRGLPAGTVETLPENRIAG
jgi:hypothetical protein